MTEQLRISNSSYKTLLRCEQQYVYKFVELLEARLVAIPLKLGTWMHLLIDAKYKKGDWKPEHRKLSREFNQMFDEQKAYYGPLPQQASHIMRGYDYHWRNDDQDWEFIDTELKLEVELNKGWVYVAKVDVVADNDEGRWLWDHKTFKAKAPTADYRIVDPQSALYDWAYERVTGIKPVGFMFNYLRTKLPTTPKLLKRGGISKAKNIDTNFYTLMAFLKKNDLDPADYREQLSAARSRDSLFYDRVFVPRPTAVIRNLLADIVAKLPRIRELHEGARPTRTLTRDCQYSCAFHLLCLTELTDGNGDYIRKHDLVQRKSFDYYDEPLVTEE